MTAGEGNQLDGAGRRAARDVLDRLTRGDVDVLAADAAVDAAHPFGRLAGAEAAAPWQALRRAFPDVERRDTVFLGGPNHPDDRMPGARPSPVVATIGSYVGTFREPFVGIPPTHGVAALTYGEAHHIVDGRVRASWLVWDVAGLLLQTGRWPLARCLGAPGHWPGPRGANGLRMDPGAGEEGASLRAVLAMHDALHAFDGKMLGSMDMSAWAEGFSYWAAGGIGACRGVDGFRAHHQIPFLTAFPDRVGAGHFIRVSDGPYAATGGDVALTHTGGEFLGVGPTGRKLRFRVMDFYRFDGDGRIAENWLPNDTLGLLMQMGVDVLGRVAHHEGRPRMALGAAP